MPNARLASLALLALAACGDDGNMVTVDAPPDPCMPLMTFTGEYVQWDSTEAAFMGIFGATFIHQGDPSKTDMTAPNGRFEMCIPAEDGIVTVGPMDSSDLIGGRVVVNRMVLQSGVMQSYRSFSATRAAEYGYNASLAHVFVHVDGGARTVSTQTAAGVQKHFDGTAWVDGNTGTDIYLGNIDASTPTTLLIATGGTTDGTGSIPLAAGSFTYVTLRAR